MSSVNLSYKYFRLDSYNITVLLIFIMSSSVIFGMNSWTKLVNYQIVTPPGMK